MDPEGLQYISIVGMIGRVLLDVREHGGRPASSNHQTSAFLISVALSQVTTQVEALGFSAGIAPLLGEGGGQELHEGVSLEAELAVAGFGGVQKQVAFKELSFQKLLETEGLQADPNQTDVVLLQLGQKRRDLFSRQPTERSSEPPEEDDDAGLVSPQLLKGCLLLGDGMGQLHTTNSSRIHTD